MPVNLWTADLASNADVRKAECMKSKVSVVNVSGRKFEVKVNGEPIATFTSKTKAYEYAATLRKETK